MLKFKKEPDSEKEIFAVLNPIVKKWFLSKYSELSLPQRFAVKEIHNRKNTLVFAPTGSTKTLTAFLSIINELVTFAEHGNLEDKVYCIYISPLKALNNDIEKNLKEPLEEIEKLFGKKLGIRIAVRTGDTTAKEKASMLKKPPHILITTPESLAIVLSSLRFKYYLKQVEFLIVDEIHALADNKRGVHLSLLLERLQNESPSLVRIGLSATISPVEEIAKFLVGFRECIIAEINLAKKMDLKLMLTSKNLVDTTALELSNNLYSLLHDLIQEHKTTLIFTNTRSATERVVMLLKESFPDQYEENIGAHHGSLSPEHRKEIEGKLKRGELKVVVTSSSLELGIDIGYVDLVVLLSSPKSVARALQRIGRSGHKLGGTTKGRLIVQDRDELAECAVLLKLAKEGKLDKIHVPKNALDVLAQQIFGIALAEPIHIEELYGMIRRSYCYSELPIKRFMELIDYLAGKHTSLESKHIYAKIWYDDSTKMIGKVGRLSRMNYMTNLGTIPEESFVLVKEGEKTIGKVDESFLEKLKRNDVFVLGGNTYQFLFAQGLVAKVKSVQGKLPNVPRWSSEALSLSYELALEIQRFRKLMQEKLAAKKTKEEVLEFIKEHMYLDDDASEVLYNYFLEQFLYAEIPHSQKILVEHFVAKNRHFVIFHALFGRKVNEVLMRALIYAIKKTEHRDCDYAINDNGFYIAYAKKLNVMRSFSLIKSVEIRKVMERAIDDSEILRRRFRHCAGRAFMILRNYKGRRKFVGRQQVTSMHLLCAVKKISKDFPILYEAKREILEDYLDVFSAKEILEQIESGKIKLKEIENSLPSPFAFNLVMQGYSELMNFEEKIMFLRRMDEAVWQKINNPKIKSEISDSLPIDYGKLWKKEEIILEEKELNHQDLLRNQLMHATIKLKLDANTVHAINNLIDGDKKGFRSDFLEWLTHFGEGKIHKAWKDELAKFLMQKKKEFE